MYTLIILTHFLFKQRISNQLIMLIASYNNLDNSDMDYLKTYILYILKLASVYFLSHFLKNLLFIILFFYNYYYNSFFTFFLCNLI